MDPTSLSDVVPAAAPATVDPSPRNLQRELIFLQVMLSPLAWRARVCEAKRLSDDLERFRSWLDRGWSFNRARYRVFPSTPRTNVQRWNGQFKTLSGEPWQRVIDLRIPRRPNPWKGSLAELIVAQRSVRNIGREFRWVGRPITA